MKRKLTKQLFLTVCICCYFFKANAQVPVAKFGPNKTINVEQYDYCQLSDSSTNNPFEWEWQVYDSTTYKSSNFYPNLNAGDVYSDPNGNGNNEISRNPEFAFDIVGSYTVRMRCRNASGWSNWIVKKNCIIVALPTLYNIGYGSYGALGDNRVDSDTGTITDDGGMNLNYGNNQGEKTRSILYVQPCYAKKITLFMNQLKFADTGDILNIYDGSTISQNNLIASWTKNKTSNPIVVANSGQMIIVFNSNNSGVDSGFYGTYSVTKDTTKKTLSVSFAVDTPQYNSVPFNFKSTLSGFSGIPKYNWTIDGNAINNNSNSFLRNTFYSDGQYNVCLQVSSCNEIATICKNVTVATPNTKTTLNFKTLSFSKYEFDSVFLIPETNKANRFIWQIQPSSYILLNPPLAPSQYKTGEILINATPGDSIYVPQISFLDTVCYTIKLKAYNSLNYTSTVDSLTKTNYICGNDFRKVYGIFGTVYNDLNGNCQYNSSDRYVNQLPVKLYDSNNQLIATTYTYYKGMYRFDKTNGNYTIRLGLNNTSITTKCPTGIDSTVSINSQSPMNGVNFGVSCSLNSSDYGSESVSTIGWVFPGQTHQLDVFAGDLQNKFKGINCYSGSNVSGTVRIEVKGKATITGAVSGSNAPNSYNGKICSYTISNFEDINIYNSFKLYLKVDTSAQSNDTIKINVKVTHNGTDSDTANNNKTYNYFIRNSYDPNEKEVYPVNVPPLYNDWLTYTIHFQNTGTAPAFNIRLEDTLDSQLDIESFNVINASHERRISLNNKVLKIYFDDIMLPDSFSNEKGSHGYFQYKIKPINGLTKGAKINNTAYIYFDYNPAIVTNTTVNEYVEEESYISNISLTDIKIYPNPSSGIFKFESNKEEIISIEVFNIQGTIVKTIVNSNDINLSQFAQGVYTAKVQTNNGTFFFKLIRQ